MNSYSDVIVLVLSALELLIWRHTELPKVVAALHLRLGGA